MYAGRRREQWMHTAAVLALTANCHRDPSRRRRPFGLLDFLPADLTKGVRTSDGAALTPDMLRRLKPLFE